MNYDSSPSTMRLIHVRAAPVLVAMICALIGLVPSIASAQVPTHPDAQSPLPENPYLKHQDAWRWDIVSQVLIRAGVEIYYEPGLPMNGQSENARSIRWPMKDIEVIFPVARSGGHYWSPNDKVSVSIRAGDFKREPEQVRLYTKQTGLEYTMWRSDIELDVHQIHMTHTSHIVVSDTVFDEKLARQLPWPDTWNEQAEVFLAPVVDSVGDELPPDTEATIKKLLDFWTEDQDPKDISQLDFVKFITGKVIEHVLVRTPPVEFSTRGGNRLSPVAFSAGTVLSGFIVRDAELVAREPEGSKHDLATLLTSILRSAGIPARTLICLDMNQGGQRDLLEQYVSLVEFAMYDPERDLTFWVPIDVDRLRLNGRRSNLYLQPWNYFGTHDELNDYVPLAYYFHAPASYLAYDLPGLYGIRSSSPLPEYAIQSISIDPQVSTVSAKDLYPPEP
jgi:transglutaminase-like putative cysteine protease